MSARLGPSKDTLNRTLHKLHFVSKRPRPDYNSPVPEDCFGHEVMLSVWWNINGIVHYELVPDGRAVNADIYSEQLSRTSQLIPNTELPIPHTKLTTNSSVSLIYQTIPTNMKLSQNYLKLLASKSLRKIAPSSTSQFTLTVANLKLDCLAVELLSAKIRSWKKSPFPTLDIFQFINQNSAIDTALKDININSPSKIIIYSDSRAAIYTLQSCFSSQEPLLKSIAKSVNRLPANSSVTVQWLPAHVGIPGNELADSLAKAGALGLPEARESTTQLDERDLLRTIKTQCLQEWKSDAAHDWYRAEGTSTGSVLPREQQSLISRLKSGHLRTMTFQNGCKVFPLCTKCNSQPATPKHIIDCIDSSIDELYSSPADTPSKISSFTSLIP
ncbi:hypothetical protein LAZ67_7002187 [Cordylochernes scorpioides]|uniref:RNase H type-1 domain-containing protein n=1 Tax=Cordylochernes scorpioides TaxID=51811 RepID=A0ABY6KPJ2_9ARAC|nr:hypothetical protein LAZ67_7002187 [Cordylochernes scorpioides]